LPNYSPFDGFGKFDPKCGRPSCGPQKAHSCMIPCALNHCASKSTFMGHITRRVGGNIKKMMLYTSLLQLPFDRHFDLFVRLWTET